MAPSAANRRAIAALTGEWTKQRGYARMLPGKAPERLLLLDRSVVGLTKADSAPVLAYRAESRDDSPDWFVASPTLSGARQVPDCEIALAHGNGGVLSSECTVIFGSAATL